MVPIGTAGFKQADITHNGFVLGGVSSEYTSQYREAVLYQKVRTKVM